MSGAGPSTGRILVVGEALIDIVDRDGSRIRHVGGSPLNVAFGLARLGMRTAFATEFGDDADGAAITAHLHDAGVTVLRTADGSRRTSTALAHIGADGSATYDFDLEWAFTTPPQLSRPAAVHVGSVGALRAPGAGRVLELVEALPEGVLVSFDPNVRPALMPPPAETRALVERYAARAGVIKLSDEDAEWLWPEHGLDAVAAQLLDRGAQLVALTRGAEGSVLHTQRDRVIVPVCPTVAVDTIGAGDAYMTGLITAVLDAGAVHVLSGALDAADLARVGRFAAAAASLTVGRAGAMPPRRAELDAALAT